VSVAENLADVLECIAKAEKRAYRASGSTQLIAVSKTFDGESIQPLLDCGQRVFGENRVQEAQGKWPQLRDAYENVELHLIGPLQSNKSKEAVALFDVIHTVDREKIAKSLAKEMLVLDKTPNLFVQVNTGEEPQKAGVLPRETVEFVQHCQREHGLNFEGLMCIPPADENPGPHFALLKKLAVEAGLEKLSMGMSGDFETAVEFGASHVRVGSALFGSR